MPLMHWRLHLRHFIIQVLSFKQRKFWLRLEWKDIYRVLIYSEKPSDCIGTCGWFALVTLLSELWCVLAWCSSCSHAIWEGVCGYFCAISEGCSSEGQAERSNPQVEWRDTTPARLVLASEATSPGTRLRSATYTYVASPANPDVSERD